MLLCFYIFLSVLSGVYFRSAAGAGIWCQPSLLHEARRNMVTQTIKRWLNKLFAWWPWRRSTECDYTQTVGDLNKGTMQEPVWRTVVDGPAPQPGNRSVAVEHETADAARELQQPRPSASGGFSSPPATPPDAAPEQVASSPASEQQLEFLQYLVKRGTFNEGFADGQLPEQYRSRR